MEKKNRKKNVIFIVALILCGVLICALGIKLYQTKKESDTKGLSYLSYSLGYLDEEGKEQYDHYTFRTDYLSAEKFEEIKLSDDSCMTYRVFFYDKDKLFINATDSHTDALTEIPKELGLSRATEQYKVGTMLNVVYYRVVCYVPEDKEKVSVVNLPFYAKQISIAVKK